MLLAIANFSNISSINNYHMFLSSKDNIILFINNRGTVRKCLFVCGINKCSYYVRLVSRIPRGWWYSVKTFSYMFWIRCSFELLFVDSDCVSSCVWRQVEA